VRGVNPAFQDDGPGIDGNRLHERYGCSPFSSFTRHTHCLLLANAGRYLEFLPASSRPSGATSERSAPGNGVTPCEKHGRSSIDGSCRLLLGTRCGRRTSGKCSVGLRHGKLRDPHVGRISRTSHQHAAVRCQKLWACIGCRRAQPLLVSRAWPVAIGTARAGPAGTSSAVILPYSGRRLFRFH
jgi:hypothetical protein